jgi:hypothetical protein
MAKRRSNHEGSIYQRENGKWRAQVTLDGRRLNFSAKTQRECQEWLLARKLKSIPSGNDLVTL